jgi:N-acetyl-D-muramate 6-phosphate phosphatase
MPSAPSSSWGFRQRVKTNSRSSHARRVRWTRDSIICNVYDVVDSGSQGAETSGTSEVVAVVFDVGETLLDDTREWGAWADWIGVPRHTFSAVLGAVTAQGRNNAETFQYFQPGFDLARERQLREDAGKGEQIDETDLYPDVFPGIRALRELGFWLGIAGNQTVRAASLLEGLGLPVDTIATSGQWGVAKPDLRFFARVVDMAPCPADQILYVGDHRDNDILPAKQAGLRTALIRRGPWGYLWADDPATVGAADWRVASLTELVAILAAQRGD